MSELEPSLTRRLAGTRAKAAGMRFEDIFLIAARHLGIAISRINDGCKTVGRQRLIRVKQPFDWIISFQGRTALIDTKSTEAGVLGCSAIDPNQRRELLKHALQGVPSGYVVWARKTREFFFIPARLLDEKSKLMRGSISPKDQGVIHLGNAAYPNLKALFDPQPEGGEHAATDRP